MAISILKVNPLVLRRLAWVACSVPFVVLLVNVFTVNLGANPVETVERETGSWALIFLLCSLAITPLRTVTGHNEIAMLRRTFGLFAFTYALVHFCAYLFLDRSLLFSEIVLDLTKRPYVMLGAAALTGLFVLALTSPRRVVKRMGAVRWKKVHKLVYLVAVLAVAHFLWLKWDKNLLEKPLVYAAVLCVLLGFRVFHAFRGKARQSRQHL